ncbi:MAG: Microtubule-severing ATPase [Solirubrobacterales bacterium]|nr:Microtubule-severing ATPase [Solirubrobacterales bacterium]
MPDDAPRPAADAPRNPADDSSRSSRPPQAPDNRQGGGSGDSPRTPWRVEPAPDGRGTPEKTGKDGKGGPKPPAGMSWRRFGILLLGLFAINFFLTTLLPGGERPASISYTPVFLQQVKKGNVKEISSRGETVSGTFKTAIDPPGKKGKTTKFTTEIPTFASNGNALAKLLEQKQVIVNAEPPNQGRSLMSNLLISLLPTLLLIGAFIFIARRAAASAGGLGAQFGRSKAKRVELGTTRTTFNDVAGIDEAEEELKEIVDFLRNPDKYKKLGAKIPRGVLLTGQPGTGKTLLARAMAGEAEVPFFSASASEFIEMIVGVGASRVRDLFDEAKKAAPAIIFIDELDAIGRARGGGGLGGHDEREQTLNQVLTEMDGFDPSIGIIVLAATNRPEILDSALLRPGRFDRRVVVQSPDKVGRAQILRVHTRSVPLEEGIDLDAIAASTPGMVGADLANLVNEAALLAAKRGHTRVALEDFTDGLEKVILGAERKVVMSHDERQRTAYHEAGHALVGMLTPGADPVRKISIIPRGMALGVTLSAPEADRFNYDEGYLRGKILVALGGRVAEEVIYGTITTGAESDIQQLTSIARGMVTRWGMSEAVGPIAVEPSSPNGMLLPGSEGVSPATQQLIDQEVRRIVDEAHHDVTMLLTEHREQLEQLTAELLKVETLDETDAYKAAGVPRASREEREAAQPTSGVKPSAPLPQPAEA